VDVHVGEVVDVLRRLSGPFDGIISSFAAMNTFDLPSFVPQAARLLRPGDRLIAHLLSPAHATDGLARRAWRMVRPEQPARTMDVEIGGQRITHWMLPEDELYRRFFAAEFARRRAYALGLVVGRRAEVLLPDAILDTLARFEAQVAIRGPWVSAGRFYVLDLERRPTVGSS
jgi:hypothetical protein